jgi:hypothetical protein
MMRVIKIGSMGSTPRFDLDLDFVFPVQVSVMMGVRRKMGGGSGCAVCAEFEKCEHHRPTRCATRGRTLKTKGYMNLAA